jgi:hypothetical protein
MSRKNALIALLLIAALAAACTRSATSSEEEIAAVATEKAVQTADAEIQQTLEALLGSATVAAPTATPQATNTTAAPTATAMVNGAQLTELAAVLTESGEEATAEATEAEEASTPSITPTPNATSSACFGARYAYDESYPDGTRVDPGQLIEKTWRLQNVGTCNWVGCEYQLVFVNGDRMNGTTPLTINITVLPGNYANFTINFRAPSEPGTYHGDWMFQTENGDRFGVGPDFDLPFWIEIIVRG